MARKEDQFSFCVKINIKFHIKKYGDCVYKTRRAVYNPLVSWGGGEGEWRVGGGGSIKESEREVQK
jgi:hypothetical protein